MQPEGRELAVSVRGLVTRFGRQVIHDGLDLDIYAGEVFGIVGGSGTGKSVLVREIIGLIKPAAGHIEVFGQDTSEPGGMGEAVRRRWGVMFQDGALFSSLTVRENIEVPLRQHTKLAAEDRRAIANLKIQLAGLHPSAGDKYPSELSGGMRKRAGLARALALDPRIVFLDEPTAGLDPIGAAEFDQLIQDLRESLGLTVVMITHDLDSLYTACDRVCVLLHKKALVGTIAELRKSPDEWLQEYFGGPRGRAASYSRSA